MGTNEPPRPRTYQTASKIGRHLLSTRDTLRTNSPRSSARPSEARPRRAKRDRRAKRGRRRRRPAPPGAPELREGRQEKLEATKLGAIQLPRFSCLGSAGRVRSTYGISNMFSCHHTTLHCTTLHYIHACIQYVHTSLHCIALHCIA